MLLAAALLAAVATTAGNSGGAALYALHCAACHGDNGQGSNVAPSLIDKPAADVHLMLDTGRMPAADPYVNEIHRAPAFTQIQIARIVSYVMTFSPHPDAALPVLQAGDPVRGRALFAEHCAMCHGTAGEGGSVGFANVAPPLGSATAFEVAEAIRAGPGVMPRFGSDVLTDRDVGDIARYVNFLQTQGDRPASTDAGGFTLAHAGPVAEGLVGWIFGLGLLLLFVRWIGTTQ